MKNKFFLIIICFLCIQIPLQAQNRICILDSMETHKEEMEQLEEYIFDLSRHNKHLKKYKQLSQFHIFRLSQSENNHIERQEYLDYSFLKRLKFNYTTERRVWYSREKKLFSAVTYLVSPEGEVVGMFDRGVFWPKWYWDSKNINDIVRLFMDNKIDFAFFDAIDSDYINSWNPNRYIFIKEDTVFATGDTFIFDEKQDTLIYKDTLRLIPLESYFFDSNKIEGNIKDQFVNKETQLFELVNGRPESCYKEFHSEIFSVLDEISLISDVRIGIDYPQKGGLGDISHIYVYNDQQQKDYDYMKYVRIKNNTAMGYWQWLLLYNLDNLLPTYWHGSYRRQEFVLTDETWKDILSEHVRAIPDSIWKNMEEIEFGTISESKRNMMAETRIVPLQISVDPDSNNADIIYCSWNDWKGLIMNRYKLSVNKNNSVSVRSHTIDIIVPYNCGVRL